MEVIGENLEQLRNEAGGHRIQRVPPTEKRGRVHTSTVTVAVMESDNIKWFEINKSDIKSEWYSGTGAGGQRRNKKQCSCRLTHLPTGIVKTSQTRSRENSLDEAMKSLISELELQGYKQNKIESNIKRKNQISNGDRNNYIRTYKFQINTIISNNGNRISINEFERGDIEGLW